MKLKNVLVVIAGISALSALVISLNIGAKAQTEVPIQYKSGAWVQVDKAWLQPGRETVVVAENEIGDDKWRVFIRVNDPSKYGFTVVDADGHAEEIETASTYLDTRKGDCQVIVYERKTNKDLGKVKFTVQ